MNVLFDATWIGSHYRKEVMHGGLRVINEVVKRLEDSEEIDLFYSSNKYDLSIINNIQLFIDNNEYACGLNKIANNRSELFRKGYYINCKVNNFLKSKLHLNLGLDLSHYNKNILTRMDIYHSPIEAIPAVIKEFKNIKRVFTSHDLMPFTRPELAPLSFKKLLKPAYDSIDNQTKIICVSEFTKSELLNYRKDLKESQIDVVYLGADKNVFFPDYCKKRFKVISKKYGFSFERYFLCLNRNQKYKNTEHIIKSYISLINQNSINDLGLVLIGTFDSLASRNIILNKYKDYINIHFIEFVPDSELSIFYSNALCFVYMSIYEGFGLPIVEAMQCGTPIISSNCASLPEVVENSGICIDPFDQDLLSNQMYSVFKNSELQKLLSKKSIERSHFFSWEKNLLETIEVYKKAMNE